MGLSSLVFFFFYITTSIFILTFVKISKLLGNAGVESLMSSFTCTNFDGHVVGVSLQ